MTSEISGRPFLQALKFAFVACPKGDENEALQHIAFVDSRLVAGDGHRWHIAHLGDGVKLASFAATRSSVNKLILMLTAAVRATLDAAPVDVVIDGASITIKYGTETLDVELDSMTVGTMPTGWEPPVPESAPLLFDAPPGLSAEYVTAATKWPGTRVTWRGLGNGPVRIDLAAYDDRIVATAVVLPTGQRATLPDPRQLSLLKGKRKNERPLGMSVLALELERVDEQTGEVLAGSAVDNLAQSDGAPRK